MVTVLTTVSARDTSPDDTLKSVVSEKDAIPLFALVASSPAIVIVSLVTVVSIPSPPVKVNVSVRRETESSVPLSAPTVKDATASMNERLPDPSVART